MIIDLFGDNWAISVPAKINLFLEVLGKRPDGYHSVQTIMSSVNLVDQLIFTPRNDDRVTVKVVPFDSEGFKILSPTDSAWDIPEDNGNLVSRALLALQARLGERSGIDVQLRKSIPSLAGLGGGSADAAAALLGGMLTWSGNYNHTVGMNLAAELGSDINFFLETAHSGNSVASCSGRGEVVDPIKSSYIFSFVIVHPPQGCSTKAVFDQLAGGGSEMIPIKKPFETMEAIVEGDHDRLGKTLWNRLTGPAMDLNPHLKVIDSFLETANGVRGHALSGSGSAMFALMENRHQAENLVKELREKNLWRAYYVSTWQSGKISEQLAAF